MVNVINETERMTHNRTVLKEYKAKKDEYNKLIVEANIDGFGNIETLDTIAKLFNERDRELQRLINSLIKA